MFSCGHAGIQGIPAKGYRATLLVIETTKKLSRSTKAVSIAGRTRTVTETQSYPLLHRNPRLGHHSTGPATEILPAIVTEVRHRLPALRCYVVQTPAMTTTTLTIRPDLRFKPLHSRRFIRKHLSQLNYRNTGTMSLSRCLHFILAHLNRLSL